VSTKKSAEVEELARVRLGQASGDVTIVGFGVPVDHEDIDVIRNANHEDLNDLSKANRKWLLSLPEDHQPYFIHLLQLDNLWPQHSAAPPVWVSCPEHPDLEQAIIDHYTGKGNEVVAISREEADDVEATVRARS
jgi:hypothetical protein